MLALLAALALALVVLIVQVNRRPPLDPYASLAVPAARADSPLKVRFVGVATLLFDDGETAWMTDGFFSRPSLARVLFTRIEPDRAAIERGLQRLGVTKLAAVVPVHSHYDHAMDAPLVAMQTGATLIGSASTLNVGRGLDLPEDRMREVRPGDTVDLGRWKLTFIASRPCRRRTSTSTRPGRSTHRCARLPMRSTGAKVRPGHCSSSTRAARPCSSRAAPASSRGV